MNTATICLCLTVWMLTFNPFMAYHDLIYHNTGHDIDENERERINKERRIIYYGLSGFLAVVALLSLFLK